MSAKGALAMAQNRAFADYIGQAIAERGWTVKGLAEQAGVTYTTSFRNLVAGRARAAPKTLERIAPVLGVDAKELDALYGGPARRRHRRKQRERENAAALVDAPSPKVTAQKPQVTLPKFSMTLAHDGSTMHVTMDWDLSVDRAFKLVAFLQENGLLGRQGG